MSVTPSQQFDVAIVGAGVVGLAHAYHAAKAGARVVVFERSPRACGASIRNFGMLWPIGQPTGDALDLATASRKHWSDVLDASGIWHERGGSMHVAYHEDEAAVLKELVDANEPGRDIEMLSPADVKKRSPWIRTDGLISGMYSATEICVDPRRTIAELPTFLREQLGVTFHFATTVTRYNATTGTVHSSSGNFSADRLIVCSGEDLQTLYPDELGSAGLFKCKLQMMRTLPTEPGDRLGPMLAAGLTLLHYKSFANCRSLADVRARFQRTMPDYLKYGIHVMASQHGTNEVTLGDSHEYGDDIEIFDKPFIDEMILKYLRTFLDVPNLALGKRWHGIYAKHPTKAMIHLRPEPNVSLVTGCGGAGMTLSFGIGERVINEVLGKSADVSKAHQPQLAEKL